MKKHHPKVNPQNHERQQRKIVLKRIKNNKKLYISSIVLVVALIITSSVVVGIQFTKSSTETTILLKDQTVEGLEFKNAKMDQNKLIVEVQNTSNNNYNLNTIDVKYRNQDGNEIVTLNGYIGNVINRGDSKQLVVETDVDLSAAYSIEYTINK